MVEPHRDAPEPTVPPEGVSSTSKSKQRTQDAITDRSHEIVMAVEHIMAALDMSCHDEPGLQETPKRIAKFLMEFRQPLDLGELLGDGFENPSDVSNSELVAQSNIPFRMLCEHHFAPAHGTAAIGYIPNKKVVGLSKLTRLVQAVGTERPSIQEAICHRVANLLQEHLDPRGVIVIIRAEHTCMSCRGVNAPNVITHTSAVRGAFRDVPAAREEFFSLIRR